MSSLLSLDIGKKNIHIVEGSFTKDIILVEKAATIDVPEGSFEGETIYNPDILAESILNGLQSHGIGTKETVMTFDAFGSVIRDITLPAAKPKEISEMIKNEMLQSYNVAPEEVIQFKKIDKVSNEEGTMLDKYRAAAIDSEIVQAYHELISSMKLKPMAMDININAMDKLLEGSLSINDTIITDNSTMLMDFGDTLTTIYIISKGKPIFFRQLDSGYAEIEKIISEQVFESEESIKTMKEDGFNFFGESVEEQKYFTILRPYFYTLMDEIRKIIGFYTSRSNSVNLDHIFLYGNGSNLKGFAEYCESNFGLPTEQITNVSKIKLKDPAIPIAHYLNAIGALIRY